MSSAHQGSQQASVAPPCYQGYTRAVFSVLRLPNTQVLVGSPLRRQRIKPDAKLTHVLASVRPKDSTLEPLLDPRDSLPGGRVAYRLVLSYSFSVSEGGKYKAAVPLTNG